MRNSCVRPTPLFVLVGTPSSEALRDFRCHEHQGAVAEDFAARR